MGAEVTDMLHESGYFRILDTTTDHQFNKSFYCPGCECHHGINDGWQLSFNDSKPTVSPSILVKHGRYKDMNDPLNSYEQIVCHLFIRDGKIEYLNDCTHALAGKTIEMQKEID